MFPPRTKIALAVTLREGIQKINQEHSHSSNVVVNDFLRSSWLEVAKLDVDPCILFLSTAESLICYIISLAWYKLRNIVHDNYIWYPIHCEQALRTLLIAFVDGIVAAPFLLLKLL